MIKILYAPIEGIATCYYRRVHHRLFPEGIFRYYTPFLSVYPNLSFRKRDLREILGDSEGRDEELRAMTIPQILAGSAEEIIWACNVIHDAGFSEVNVNTGCPSPTVVKKGRGSGLLADPDVFADIWDKVFSSSLVASGEIRLSVKTRLGIADLSEFERILPVLERYPFSRVIIHPRVRNELYGGSVHKDAFTRAYDLMGSVVVYNGDLVDTGDITGISEEFPLMSEVMLGRGLLADPALAREYAGGAPLSAEELRRFMTELEEEYKNAGLSEYQILCKLKELWSYWGRNKVIKRQEQADKYLHKIRVSHSLADYRNVVRKMDPFRS